MGLLGGVKSRYKKSEAAVVVQKLLEHQTHVGMFDLDPAMVANRLVGNVWRTKPNIFDGKFGQRPHKITVAASALAYGIEMFDDGDTNRIALVLSLCRVLTEVETNGRLYPLNSLDNQLLEVSAEIFSEISKKISESPLAQEIDKFMDSSESATWESWYKIF